jgi:hypothetical protein
VARPLPIPLPIRRPRSARDFVLWGVSALMLLFATLWVVGELLEETPEDAAGVLAVATIPPRYAFETQIVRVFDFNEQEVRTESLITGLVDTENDEFEVSTKMNLVGPEYNQPMTVQGNNDETFLFRAAGADGRGETEGVLPEDRRVPPALVRPPYPSEIAQANPVLADDRARVSGRTAWALDVQATPTLILQSMLSEALRLEETIFIDDLIAILDGEYIDEGSQVWVDQATRRVILLDLRFAIPQEPVDGFAKRPRLRYRVLMQIGAA